jgi:tetratricopeptide (TPR) repeat protein
MVVAGLVSSPLVVRNIQNLKDRVVAPVFFPTPRHLLTGLNDLTAGGGPVTVLADQDLSVTIPAYVANANVVAHRIPTTSEVFPADQQNVALQRLIDQYTFFHTPYLTANSVDILQRYNVQYVVVASGSSLDMQLRLAPQWFEWLMDDQSFSLYGLHQLPTTTASILGNSVLVQRQWSEAEQYYQAALQQSSGDLLALTGLAEIARAQGQYDVAVTKLQQAKSQIDVPILHYRLGQLYAESGQVDQSAIEFDLAQRVAQGVSRFHVALGDACLNLGQVVCTTAQYQGAVATENLPDEASRYIAQADLWRQQGRTGHALSLYEQAVDLNSSEYYQFVLESVYREVGQFERAEQVVQALRVKHPFSVEVVSATANVMAAQNRHHEAIRLYRYAIWLQNIQAQETVDTRLALTQVLLAADLLADARAEIEVVLALHPHNALAYRLMGDLYSQQQEFEQATAAYWQAFQLDPGQVAVYVALSNQLRLQGGRSEEALQLLETTIRFNPDEASLFLALGDQWQRSGDGTAAINAYLSALDRLDAYSLSSPLRRQPAVQSRAYAYARLARLYEDLGQLEPAMNYYRSAVVAAPNLPWPHVVLGDALRRRNDSAGAEAAYHQAIQVDNTHVNAYVRLAELHYNRGDITQSNELYDLAEQLALIDAGQAQKVTTGLDSHSQAHPPDPALESDETLVAPDYRLADQATLNASAIARQLLEADEEINTVFELARLYQARDQTNQAIQLYQEKLRQGQVENWSKAVLARYRKNLGDLYLSQRQYEQAVNEYQQAVTLDSWWPEARLSLAEALFQQGDPVNALQHIQVAASNAPGSIVAQVALANILDQWGDRDRALTVYQTVAQTYPGNVRATLALAQAWRDRDHWQQAEESYRDTITLNPGMIEAYIGLAELFIDQNRYEEAKTLLEQALEIESQNITAYVRLGELEQRRGNPEQALTWYKEAAVVAETGQTIDMTLIDSLLWYGDYDRAMAYVQRSLDRQPGDSELLLRLSRIHRALGHNDDAASTLFEAKRLHSANSRLNAELAELHLDRGDPQTALDFYQQAIGLEPAEVVYYIAASQIMATQGRYSEALALLEAGQSRVSDQTGLYTTMSTLYTQQGETDLALSILEQALREVGENEQLLLAMGSYFASRGNFDQVEQRYNQALELQPDAAAVHAALADLYLRQNLYDQALEHYEQAVALVPGNPGYYLSLGNAYRQAERTDEAITTYARTVATAPTLVEAYVNLAALYQQQSGWDEAQAVYEQGLVVIPTSGRLLTQYSAFLIERGDEAQALVLLDQAGQVAPTAATLIARATLYGELGRVDDAQRDLQTALQKEPGSIDALLALGDLARTQENIEAAKQWYQQAVSQRPGVPAGYLRLGSLAAEERDRDAALEYSRAAREAEPGGLLRPDDQ